MRAMKYIIILWANWRRQLGTLRQGWLARWEGDNLYPPPCAIQTFLYEVNRVPAFHSFIKLTAISNFPLKPGLAHLSLNLEAILVWKPP